jgi:hypothetical protein
MAKSREEVQDIALNHMDRINRNTQGERVVKNPSLKEQLDEEKRRAGLSESEKLKELDWSEWSRKLRDWLTNREMSRRHTFTERFLQWIWARHKPQLEQFHQTGTTYTEMLPWFSDKQMEHINL